MLCDFLEKIDEAAGSRQAVLPEVLDMRTGENDGNLKWHSLPQGRTSHVGQLRP
jgi:hypothetical protein